MNLQQQLSSLESQLRTNICVVVLGAYGIGKTRLATEYMHIHENWLYVDLKESSTRSKIRANPKKYFQENIHIPMIIDHLECYANVFSTLCDLCASFQSNHKMHHHRFLVFSCASIPKLSEDSLGYVSVLHLSGVHSADIVEMYPDLDDDTRNLELKYLWTKGSYPGSYCAPSYAESFEWRKKLVKEYVKLISSRINMKVSNQSIVRLWTMLSHLQGERLDIDYLAELNDQEPEFIQQCIDAMQALMLLRPLPSFTKRVIKSKKLSQNSRNLRPSPSLYLRDSGIVHALVGLCTLTDIFYHHLMMEKSWKGFVVESILTVLPKSVMAYHYGVCEDSQIELLLVFKKERYIAIHIHYSHILRMKKAFHVACKELNIKDKYHIHPGTLSYFEEENTKAKALNTFIKEELPKIISDCDGKNM